MIRNKLIVCLIFCGIAVGTAIGAVNIDNFIGKVILLVITTSCVVSAIAFTTKEERITDMRVDTRYY